MIKETFTGTQVGMVLEDVRDDFKVIAEQHTDIMKKIGGLDDKVGSLEGKLDNFIVETRDNFKAVFDYLSRIEDDFVALKEKVEELDAKKTSSKDFKWLKNKVLEIEKKLEEHKKQQTMLSAKM
ncbi:MAG: hypothetical protein NT170_01435 [Candidatus Moranbacteria bacterium]|nr:hypothetical protein [Candidatus Moranbacteria bacterium]